MDEKSIKQALNSLKQTSPATKQNVHDIQIEILYWYCKLDKGKYKTEKEFYGSIGRHVGYGWQSVSNALDNMIGVFRVSGIEIPNRMAFPSQVCKVLNEMVPIVDNRPQFTPWPPVATGTTTSRTTTSTGASGTDGREWLRQATVVPNPPPQTRRRWWIPVAGLAVLAIIFWSWWTDNPDFIWPDREVELAEAELQAGEVLVTRIVENTPRPELIDQIVNATVEAMPTLVPEIVEITVPFEVTSIVEVVEEVPIEQTVMVTALSTIEVPIEQTVIVEILVDRDGNIIETSTPIPEDQTRFEEDFEDANLSAPFKLIDGDPIYVNGLMSSNNGPVTITIGEDTWRNYEVAVSMRDVFGGGGRNIIGVRAQDSNNMVAVTWHCCGGWFWYMENGTLNDIPQAGWGGGGSVKVTVNEDSMFLSGNTIPINDYTSGPIYFTLGNGVLDEITVVRHD